MTTFILKLFLYITDSLVIVSNFPMIYHYLFNFIIILSIMTTFKSELSILAPLNILRIGLECLQTRTNAKHTLK